MDKNTKKSPHRQKNNGGHTPNSSSVANNNNSDGDIESADNQTEMIKKRFLRVGTTTYKRIHVENKRLGTKEPHLIGWSKAAIKEDYPKADLSEIPKYDNFTVHPDFKNYSEYHTIIHENIVTKSFNLVKPLPFKFDTVGGFPHIKEFLLHIFGDKNSDWDNQKEGDSLTVAIDCYRLKLQTPTQLLPVVCLVSKEQETGKTTALKFNRLLFGNNATIIGKEHLESQFNTTYADKLVIGVDENFIALEKRDSKERIKQIATTDRIFYNPKGVRQQEIDFYGWLWFTSNDENDFMQIDENDKRFWIVKVHSVRKKNPDLEKKMLEEIPYFLNYCMYTPVVHPKKTRFWFDSKHTITEQMKKVVEFTRPRLDAAIIDFVEEIFTTYWITEFSIPLKKMTDIINDGSKYKFDKNPKVNT